MVNTVNQFSFAETTFSPTKNPFKQIAELNLAHRGAGQQIEDIISEASHSGFSKMTPLCLMALKATAKMQKQQGNNVILPDLTPILNSLDPNQLQNGKDLKDIVWSLAILDQKNYPHLDVLARWAVDTLPQIDIEDLSIITWSFACLDYKNSELFLEILNSSRLVKRVTQASEEALSAFGNAIDHARTLNTKVKINSTVVQTIKANQIESSPSNLHLNVSKHMASMGIEHENEKLLGLSKFVDIAVCDRKLVIEVDGPCHRFKAVSDNFKERTLKNMGWSVAHISYKDWDKSDKQKKTALIEKIIDQYPVLKSKASEHPTPAQNLVKDIKAVKVKQPIASKPVFDITVDLTTRTPIITQPVETAYAPKPHVKSKRTKNGVRKVSLKNVTTKPAPTEVKPTEQSLVNSLLAPQADSSNLWSSSFSVMTQYALSHVRSMWSLLAG